MKIERRILLAAGVTFLSFSAVLTASFLIYSWFSFSEIKTFDRKTLYEQKTAQLENQVDFAYSIALHHYNNEALPQEERRRIAVDELRALRYDGGAGSYYAFEKRDDGYVYAFHGEEAQLAGQRADLETKDLKGRAYVREIIESAGLRGTHVEYSIKKSGRVMRRIAYARNVSDWNWTIVGSIDVADIEKAIAENDARLDAIVKRTLAGTAILVALMLAVSIAVMKQMTSRVVRPIERISRSIGEVHANRDLTKRMESHASDEVGVMSAGINDLLEGISVIVREIVTISVELRGSSGDMLELSRSFAGSATEQASDAEEVTAAVEEVSAASESIAKNAERQADELAFLSAEMSAISELLAELGGRLSVTDELARRMDESSRQGEGALENIHAVISDLRANSGQMDAIIALIMDISDKINLLSLNAAIESARAGEAGRGFAVVADQISKLADETSGSIKSIESLIRENNGRIVAAAQHATGAGESFQVIRADMNDMKNFLGDISSSMGGFVSRNDSMNEKVRRVAERAAAIRSAMSEHMSAMAGITQATADITAKSGYIAENSRSLEDAASALESCADRLNSKSGQFIV